MPRRPLHNPTQVETSTDPDGTVRLRVSGRLAIDSLATAWKAVDRLASQSTAQRVIVDASAITYCDAGGAALFVHLEQLQAERGGDLEIRDFPEDFQPILELVSAATTKQQTGPPKTPMPYPERVGRYTVELIADCRRLVAYVGELVAGFAFAARHPRSVRWRDAAHAAQTAGVDSLPVVALVCLLLGLVLGFQSARQLHQLGADIFLADLIGLSLVRELGPLMTAVILTARSGSAFAAEIGTMRINEEVDALRTMGLDPVRFLVIPRVFAAVVMTPVLTLFANLAGLIGGAIVWVFTLELSLPAYAAQLKMAISLTDVASGLVKAFVFGILVAAVGCIRGMQTSGGSTGVGRATTNSVVSGIVLIAITDSLFSILYFYIGV